MRITIELDTEKSLDAQLQEITDFFNKKQFEGSGQKKLNKSNDKQVLCANCTIDFYDLYVPDEAQKVNSYSNDKIGKPLCRECQKKHWNKRGDDA